MKKVLSPALICSVIWFLSAFGVRAAPDEDLTPVENPPASLPRARFVLSLTLPGALTYPSPWSPSRPILVYHDRSGSVQSHAIDFGEPNPAPWTVFEGSVQEIGWSPDGTWIVGKTVRFEREEGAPPFLPTSSLTAIPVLRSPIVVPPEELAAGRGMVRFLWGCDGNIWYRESQSNAEWQSVTAPDAWKRSNPALPHSCIIAMHHESPWKMMTGDLWIYFIETGTAGIHERPISFDQDVPAVLSVRDQFVSDRRILATVHPMGKAPYQAVIDADGAMLAKFDEKATRLPEAPQRFRTGFYPGSVSADGTLLAGTRGTEDGHAMYSSEIFIADVNGAWVIPLEGAPQGREPCFARQGTWIAFAGFDSDLIHVGRVHLEQ